MAGCIGAFFSAARPVTISPNASSNLVMRRKPAFGFCFARCLGARGRYTRPALRSPRPALATSVLPPLLTAALLCFSPAAKAQGPVLNSPPSNPSQSGPPPNGQSGQPGAPAAAADGKVVTLPVTVLDKHGRPVPGLTPDDFNLKQDGQPQTIRSFTQATNLPLTVGLLIDTTASQRNGIAQERSAGKSFLDQMVTDKNRAFVVQFDREAELLEDLTPDHAKLEKALDELQIASGEPSGDADSSDTPRTDQGGGNVLYDSIFLASDELMSKQTGRKAIVVLSDGVDRGSKESLYSAIESAQRAGTIVYSIYLPGQVEQNGAGQRNGGSHFPGFPRGGWPGGFPGGGGNQGGGTGGSQGGGPGGPGGQRPVQKPNVDGKKLLEQISAQTGGSFFEVDKRQTVDQIYASIAGELQNQYMLGYTPGKGSVDGFHAIELRPKKKDLFVETAAGYYSDR